MKKTTRQNLVFLLCVLAVPAGASPDSLADLLMYSHLGWQQQLALFPAQPEAALAYAMQLQWEALRPWLTNKGLAQLELFSEKKKQI